MIELKEPRSQASQATAALRKKIIECQLVPGQRLHINSLAQEFSVSPGAIREALSRLASEHLVVAIDQRGFRVNDLALEDMRDIFDTRAEIEEDAVRMSVMVGDEEWRSALESTFRQLQVYDGKPVQHAAAHLHESFHRILVAACPSPWKLRLYNMLYSASDRYRYFAIFKLAEQRNPAAEHEGIFQAAISGDGDLAGLLVRRHIERTRDMLSRVLTDQFEASGD